MIVVVAEMRRHLPASVVLCLVAGLRRIIEIDVGALRIRGLCCGTAACETRHKARRPGAKPLCPGELRRKPRMPVFYRRHAGPFALEAAKRDEVLELDIEAVGERRHAGDEEQRAGCRACSPALMRLKMAAPKL